LNEILCLKFKLRRFHFDAICGLKIAGRASRATKYLPRRCPRRDPHGGIVGFAAVLVSGERKIRVG
jgi:hypothetical protein